MLRIQKVLHNRTHPAGCVLWCCEILILLAKPVRLYAIRVTKNRH
ncbi:hypothetical protein HMPREF0758_4300 [Serratia odorifera DSM 4582]|uniref:Uncharacterized protein n=1 Tax=Serratia odorifera DSM 4582 TaxID=667129 RepID=D4E800_SEROD|nr:hypothetical protein HMPREF0758_4300 [Serratia odorifera DSM 4582]